MTTDFRGLCAELTDCLEKADWPHRYKVVFQQWRDIARAALAEPELQSNHPGSPDSSDGPAVSDDREPASVTDQLNYQLYRRAKILFVRKVIDQAIRDTASVHWRVADTGEQLVRATDLLAWAEHMEKQMEQLDD